MSVEIIFFAFWATTLLDPHLLVTEQHRPNSILTLLDPHLLVTKQHRPNSILTLLDPHLLVTKQHRPNSILTLLDPHLLVTEQHRPNSILGHQRLRVKILSLLRTSFKGSETIKLSLRIFLFY